MRTRNGNYLDLSSFLMADGKGNDPFFNVGSSSVERELARRK